MLKPTLPDLPSGPWRFDAKPRTGSLSELSKFEPRHLFKNDFLSYCKILGIFPHPCILPTDLPILVPTTQRPSAKIAARRRATIHSDDAVSLSARLDVQEEKEDGGITFDFTPKTDLIIKNTLMGKADTFALCAALRSSTTIYSLTFYGAALTVQQIYELADALPYTSIKTLSIECNALDGPDEDTSIKQQNEPKEEGDSSVQFVKLPTRTRSSVWSYLCKRYSCLERLSLRGNKLGMQEALHLGGALALNADLRELSLSNNDLGDEGARLLSLGLRENRALMSLSLAFNNLSVIGAAAIVRALLPTYTLSTDELDERIRFEDETISNLLSEIRLIPLQPGKELVSVNPKIKVMEEDLTAAIANEESAKAAIPPPPSGKNKPDPRTTELEAIAAAATAAVHAAEEALKDEKEKVVRPSFPPLLPSISLTLADENSPKLIRGEGNLHVRALDIVNNPAIGVSGLSELASLLTEPYVGSVSSILSDAQTQQNETERKDSSPMKSQTEGVVQESKEMSEISSSSKTTLNTGINEDKTAVDGLRVVAAYFTACVGDRRQLPPIVRSEIENAVHSVHFFRPQCTLLV
jgi:hypothetical protein